MKSYNDLKVYQDSFELFMKVHRFSLRLPKYELYEQGSQLRRSADSVNSNIVEGYGRKSYKKDFLRFLTFAHASNCETINHLRKIAAVYPSHKEEALKLIARYDNLGVKLHNFREYVRKSWRTTPTTWQPDNNDNNDNNDNKLIPQAA